MRREKLCLIHSPKGADLQGKTAAAEEPVPKPALFQGVSLRLAVLVLRAKAR